MKSITAQSKTKSHDLSPLIGIGASAGGLSALKKFFNKVPEDSGLSFVVVVHLSPEHKSMFAEILQSHTKIKVQQVTKTIKLNPDHVYIIPPNANINAFDTHLRLSKLEEERSQRATIDNFFRTLAETHKEKAAGIILTGTGTDGTRGLKEIKDKGGLTIAQDPKEAEYEGMPQSAINTGHVDKILPLMEIPTYIIEYFSTNPKLSIAKEGQKPENSNKVYFRR
jgi:two-component system, chemotaxis family, CheB/CheR fusion protein